MHTILAERTPVDRLDAIVSRAEAAPDAGHPSQPPRQARVIEIGEVTAGIAVPEERGVRFFSSSRDFDGLDGTVFRDVEQAARAVRERIRARPVDRAAQQRPRGV